MIKRLLTLALLLVSTQTQAARVYNENGTIDVTTQKVTYIDRYFDPALAFTFAIDTQMSLYYPGPRIIVIDSLGGIEQIGSQLINVMELEKIAGVQQICVVIGNAASMAFNLLTHCDVRLGVQGSLYLYHPIAHIITDSKYLGKRLTARTLREAARDLDALDMQYNIPNRLALHMTKKEFNYYLHKDKWWTLKQMIDYGYIKSLVKFNK